MKTFKEFIKEESITNQFGDVLADTKNMSNISLRGTIMTGMDLSNKNISVDHTLCSECGNPSWRTLSEEKQKGVDGKVCWKGYKRMGTKEKGGKTVDNCVKM